MDIPYRAFELKADTYAYLLTQLKAVLDDTGDLTAGLSNASAVISLLLPRLNWAGFYLLRGDTLILGPFQGKPAVSSIGPGRGVCGTAVAQDRTQLIQDVHQCDNHIACDLNSRSEIVVPLRPNGKVAGVLDIDSPVPGRFDREDQEGLEKAAELISEWMVTIQQS